MPNDIEISIILPCLNEERAIISCLSEIKRTVRENSLLAEVIVVDNNSSDASAALVSEFQKDFPELILARETKEGYGFAYQKGLRLSRGLYIFMADADGTYDFTALPQFLDKLKDGYGLVVGNRFSGQMNPASMPWLHRYLGNPCLSFLVRLFFGVRITDIHCGARALSRQALSRLNLCTGGMEFASEMIIKAAKKKIELTEIPIEYRARLGESKLRSWADGWRHLRFILLYSPLLLFIIPGLIIFTAGLSLTIALYSDHLKISGVHLYAYPMFIFSAMIIIGYQLVLFGGFAKVYTVTHLGDDSRFIQRLFRHITIAKTGLVGLACIVVSGLLFFFIFRDWVDSGFGAISEARNFIAAFTVLILGIQTFFSAFMFSILGIKGK